MRPQDSHQPYSRPRHVGLQYVPKQIVRWGVIWTLAVSGVNVAGAEEDREGKTVFPIGFEEREGYLLGSEITDIEGWSSNEELGGVVIEDALIGGQSLHVGANEAPVITAYRAVGLPDSGVRFIRLSVRPVPHEGVETATKLDLWGSGIGFVLGENHTVQIRPGDATSLLATPVRVNQEGQGNQWLTLVIRQDLASGRWDLFMDGALIAVDLEMAEERESLQIAVGPFEVIGLDGIEVGTENPLFVDSDRDGMSDAYEIAHGLNPYMDDRNGDRDGDGVRNIDEALAGTAPDVAGTGALRDIIYVDNARGHDTNSGQRSHGAGADGPKHSIKAAMAAAKNGAVIVVLPGTGTYQEGSRSAKGKRITIRTVKLIIIK